TLCSILIDRGLIGVSTVHQAFGGDTTEHPAKLGDLGHIGLSIERDLPWIQPGRQPGRSYLKPRTRHSLRVVTFDQGVIIGHEIKSIHVLLAAGFYRGADCTGVVAQMRCTGGSNAGQYTSSHSR